MARITTIVSADLQLCMCSRCAAGTGHARYCTEHAWGAQKAINRLAGTKGSFGSTICLQNKESFRSTGRRARLWPTTPCDPDLGPSAGAVGRGF